MREVLVANRIDESAVAPPASGTPLPASRAGRFARILAALVVLAAAGGGAWWWHERGAAQQRAAAAARPAPTVPVTVAAAARADVPIYGTGIGAVQAYNTVTVRTRVDGEVQKIAFEEGQVVKAGDLLAQIDPRPFKAALDQAVAKKAQDDAQLANLQADLQRYNQLAERAYASRQQLETQQASVAGQQALIQGDAAAVENARTQLDYATITAPLSGKLGLRLVDQGNIVHASDANGIVTISQIEPISAVFTLPERLLGAVRGAFARGKVPVTATAGDGRTTLATGELQVINNEVDQATGTIRLKAVFPNTDGKLWPGLFVNLRALLETRERALTVPPDAIQRGQDGLAAYVVRDDGTAEYRKVKVGQITGDLAIVEDGLREGERVVVSGQYRLRDGARVTVNDPRKGPEAGGGKPGEQASAEAPEKQASAGGAKPEDGRSDTVGARSAPRN